MKPEQAQKLSHLEDEMQKAKDIAKNDPSLENRLSYRDKWNALSAYAAEVKPLKRGSYCCKAGKRQQAERRRHR